MKILTANHLLSGDVVYLAEKGWSPVVHDAVTAESSTDEGRLLARGQAAVDANMVVEPYLVEVRREGEHIEPLHYREQFRARGPSVRTDLGKQASL